MVKVNGKMVEVNSYPVYQDAIDYQHRMVVGAIMNGRGGLAKAFTMDLVKMARKEQGHG